MLIPKAILALTLCVLNCTAGATDIANNDARAYRVKIQGEGNLSVSTYTVPARGNVYGLCNYSFCTFEIAGQKVNARKVGRLTIRGGKFVR